MANWKSKIVAPVSRSVGVTGLARSVAFYRDVLGFAVDSSNLAVLGPARIEFEETDAPPGPAILFFQTDDVVSLRSAIRARGGAASELENMNLLKIQMFEIRDPDGHALWFGQSYQQPDRPDDPSAMFEKALPEIALDDVPAGIAYYRDVLGFKINYQQDDLGVVYRNQATLLLLARTNQNKGAGSAYFYVRDADALYAEVKATGAHVLGEPVSHPWGLREFHVRDLEGNLLKFGQAFE